MRHEVVLNIDDFSGGLVTKASPLKLETKQSPNCLNVHSDLFGALQKRKGFTEINGTSLASTSYGLACYTEDVYGTKVLVGLYAAGLRKMDRDGTSGEWDGTWDTVTQDSKGALSSDYLAWDTFNYQGSPTLLLTTRSRDFIHEYIGSTTTTIVAGAPRGRYLKSWKNHLWVANCEQEIIVDDCETLWDGETGDNTVALDTTDFMIGSSSAQVTVHADSTTGLMCSNTVTSVDLYACDTIRFWLRSSINLASGDYRIGISETASLGGTPQYVNVPAITAATWTYCTGSLSTSTANRLLRDAVISVGLDAVVDKGACVIEVDQITGSYTEPDLLRRSDLDSYKTWTGTGSGYSQIFTQDDIGIMGLEVLGGRLYVFKTWSIHRLTYLGGQPLIDIRQVKSGIGTAAPRTIVIAETAEYGEVIFFLGSDKQIYQFDGDNSTPIGEAIQIDNGDSNIALNNIDADNMYKAHAINMPEHHWAVFFLPIDDNDDQTQATCNYAIVYDYFSKSFWPFSNMAFAASIYTYDGNTTKVPIVSDGNKAHTFDNGTSDNGTAIAGSWISSKIKKTGEKGSDSTSHLKKASHAEFELSAVGAYDITFSWRKNWESGWTAFDTVTQSTNTKSFELGSVFNSMQFKINDSTSTTGFSIYSLAMLSDTRGQGR